ncbi:hypothetical protein RJ639_039508, partial [Escallonia herrerae]
DNDGNDHQQQDDPVASPLPAVPLVLLRHLQLLRPAPDERVGSVHLALDIVQLRPLTLNQHRHVQKHLVQLLQVPLHLLHRVVPLLNLHDRVHHLPPPLLLNVSLCPVDINESRVPSSAFSPVTVKYRLCTVSRYSVAIRWRRSLKEVMESWSFLRNPLTTEVRVRSEEDPGPQPGRLRLAALDRSRASRRTLMSLAFLREEARSVSMVERRVLDFSWAACRLPWRASRSRRSSLMASTSSKNLSRLTPEVEFGELVVIWILWDGDCSSLRKRENEPENRSFMMPLSCFAWFFSVLDVKI